MEIDLNAPGAFALLCRCGKPQVQCATHEAAVAPDRVLLPAGVEPVHYDVDLTLRLNDHAFDGTTTIKVAVERHPAAQAVPFTPSAPPTGRRRQLR